MTTPKYTFLLPAFKGKYLDEMLRSIKAQTYQDFKVLISDDCSPEDLRSICEPYLSDPRFSYRRNEENMGSKSLVSHWNLLVDMCDTEYLIMASDDDVYEPQFLAEIDALTQKYPQVDLFRGRVKIIDGDGELLEKDMMLDEYLNQLDFIYYFLGTYTIKCLANYVFKTSALKQKGYFYDLPLAWGSDNITAIVLSENGIGSTSNCRFSFRRSDVNISTRVNDLSTNILKTRGCYEYIKFLEKYVCELSSKVKTKLEIGQLDRIKNLLYKGFYVKKLAENSEKCSYSEMRKYYRYLDHLGYFTGKLDKIHFFWSWIRAYKTRRIR